MRQLRFGAAMILALALAGCINSTTVINVRPDGSGTIEQTMTMNAQAAAQLRQMSSAFAQGGGKAEAPDPFNEKDLRAAASKMGEGVSFVSATPIHTAQAEGTRAVYAFTDITKLRMDQKPARPAGGGGGMPGGTSAEEMLFQFAKTPAGTSKVTVVFPERKFEARKTPPAQPVKAADPMQAAALGMVKQMLNGLRIAIVMQPVGRLVKTNSPYVQGGAVTLLEMDFGQLLADEAMLQKLQGAGSLEEAKTLLQGTKGVKINPGREVAIEFAK